MDFEGKLKFEIQVFIYRAPDETLPVYNYVNGESNPLTKSMFDHIAHVDGPEYMPSTAVYYPEVIIVNSKEMFTILNFFVHLLPALVGDMILRILGKRPR